MSDEVGDVIEVDITEWKKLKVGELRKRVAEVGLDTKGTKAELIARVEKYLSDQEADLLEEEEEEEEEEAVEEDEQEDGDEGTGENGEAVEDGGEAEDAGQSNGPAAGEQTTSEVKPSTSSTDTPAPTALSDNERILLRAERFGGNESSEAKKAARAERFGLQLGKRSAEDMEKLKKRSERFGCATSPVITGIEDQEKKKKRLERFGASSISPSAMGTDERKKRRAERFGTS